MSERTLRKQLNLALAGVERAERTRDYRLAIHWQHVVTELQEKLDAR